MEDHVDLSGFSGHHIEVDFDAKNFSRIRVDGRELNTTNVKIETSVDEPILVTVTLLAETVRGWKDDQ